MLDFVLGVYRSPEKVKVVVVMRSMHDLCLCSPLSVTRGTAVGQRCDSGGTAVLFLSQLRFVSAA